MRVLAWRYLRDYSGKRDSRETHSCLSNFRRVMRCVVVNHLTYVLRFIKSILIRNLNENHVTKGLTKIQNQINLNKVKILVSEFRLTLPDWFSRNSRRLFFDMHLPDWTQPGQSSGDQNTLREIATRFEPEELVKAFGRSRINVAVILRSVILTVSIVTQISHKHTGLQV
jgi:hypothetical protein